MAVERPDWVEHGIERLYDIDTMLADYESQENMRLGLRVDILGLQGFDGYNPSNAFNENGDYYHALRVEPRDDEYASQTVFAKELTRTHWRVDQEKPALPLQDPFVSRIHGELIVGGVKILNVANNYCTFRTEFYRGQDLDTLEHFAVGPLNMKDIRLVEADEGKIGVFTRPQGFIGGKGSIGYRELSSLEQLNAATITQAPLLPVQPVADQWWGANDAYNLGGGNLGVLGHIAKKDSDGARHYYPIAFVYNTRERAIVQEPGIIATRSDFPAFPAKHEGLEDVVFTSGMLRGGGKAILYAGLSDSAVGTMHMEDPFKRYDHSHLRVVQNTHANQAR